MRQAPAVRPAAAQVHAGLVLEISVHVSGLGFRL